MQNVKQYPASDLISPLWEKIITGHRDEIELQQLAEDWIIGVLMGSMGQAGDRVIKGIRGGKAGENKIRYIGDDSPALQEELARLRGVGEARTEAVPEGYFTPAKSRGAEARISPERTQQPSVVATSQNPTISETLNPKTAESGAIPETVTRAMDELGTHPSAPLTGLEVNSLEAYGTTNAERQAEFRRAIELAKRYGTEVDVAEIASGADGEYQNGRITINPNAKNPVMTVLVHELTHHMENSGRYGDFSRSILSYLENEMGVDVDTMKRAIRQEYAEGGYQLDDDAATREIVAKFAESKLFTDEAAINRLARENRNLFEIIRDWLSDMAVKLTGTSEEKFIRNAERMYQKALQSVGEVADTGAAQYMFAGKNTFGDDVFETTGQLKGLTYSEKIERFKENFYREGSPQYIGKKIRFQADGRFYEAEIDRQTQRENTKKLNACTLSRAEKAKVNLGAAGDFVTLLENARLDKAGVPIKGINNDAKKGVDSMDYHLKDVVVDGKPYEVVINIRNKGDGHFVYEVKLRPNKKRPPNGPQLTDITGKHRHGEAEPLHRDLDNSLDDASKNVKSNNQSIHN